MIAKVQDQTIPFLAGGGEMGALIRAKDWDQTPVGPVTEWPQSLRTTLSILLHSKFPMFLWWGPELICFYNDAYRPSLGQNGKHPDILGMPAADAWQEIWTIIKPLIDQVLAGGEATWSEDQLIPIYRNGKIEDVYWTFSYSPVNDESGKPAGVLVTCNETTEKVNRLKKIEESEKRFRNTVKQVPTGITILRGPQFMVEMANETYLQIIDKKENDFVGRPLLHSLPEVKEAVEPLLTGVLTTGIPYHGIEFPVTLHRHGQHEKTWFDFVYYPLKEDDNSISGVIVVATEVTASAIARKKIEEAETRLRLATEAAELATWDLDVQTWEIIYSPRLPEIFGYDRTANIPYHVMRSQIHPDDIHTSVEKAYDLALQTGMYKYEARIIKPDSSLSWIRTQGKLIFDEKGNPLKLIGTIRDITEEKNYQQELQEREQKFRLLADSMESLVQERTGELEAKNRELEKMNAELKSFAYVSSHDLQEPLRKIQTFASRILEKEYLNLSETGKHHFNRMHEAAKRMQTLIEDLLAYSRTNTTDLNFEMASLHTIAEEIKAEFKEDIQHKNARIEIGQLYEARIIPFQFHQLLHNLVSNSLKFAKPDQPLIISITGKLVTGKETQLVSLIPQKKYCHITITDNGIGFDPQYKDRIFEVFQRLHGKDEYSGTGIGLAIVKKIVENHHGVITATGEVNKGARFDMYIPAW